MHEPLLPMTHAELIPQSSQPVRSALAAVSPQTRMAVHTAHSDAHIAHARCKVLSHRGFAMRSKTRFPSVMKSRSDAFTGSGHSPKGSKGFAS